MVGRVSCCTPETEAAEERIPAREVNIAVVKAEEHMLAEDAHIEPVAVPVEDRQPVDHAAGTRSFRNRREEDLTEGHRLEVAPGSIVKHSSRQPRRVLITRLVWRETNNWEGSTVYPNQLPCVMARQTLWKGL